MPADYNIPFPLTTKHQPAMNPYLSQLQPYPFARLREAMQDIHPPEGVAPVPLQIGEPKHPAPAVITDALTAALPRLDAYPQTAGLPELRQACAGFLQRRYGITLDPDSEIHPLWQQLIIGSGIAIIVASLLYYLGIFG